MARRNDLELSPAQEVATSQKISARVVSQSKVTGRDPADPENGERIVGKSNEVDSQIKGVKDADSVYEELQSDDAEDLAELINGASLTGTNILDLNSAEKPSEDSFPENINTSTANSSHGPLESHNTDFSRMHQSSISQAAANPPQITIQTTLHTSDLSEGAELFGMKTLARPKVTYGDKFKTQKPKRSGRPDLYDVPPSPPRTSNTEIKSSPPRRRGPKPKRAPNLSKSEMVAIVVDGESTPFNDELANNQMQVEHAGKASDRATRIALVSKERIAGIKRATRSTTALNPINSDKVSQLSYPGQSGLVTNSNKVREENAVGQAGVTGVELLESQNELRGHCETDLRAEESEPVEKSHVTPSRHGQETERISTPENIQPGLHRFSPILHDPNPLKGMQSSPKRLQRPSKRPTQAPRLSRDGGQTALRPEASTESISTSFARKDLTGKDADIPQAYGSSKILSYSEVVSRPRGESAGISFDSAIMSEMVETIKIAGCNSKGEKMTVDRLLNSKLGDVLTTMLTQLTTRYQNMNKLISANVVDVGKVDREHQKVLKLIEIIRKKSQDILTKRLGDKASGEKNAKAELRKNMLEDLYLNVIPGLVAALNDGLKSRPDREIFRVSDLEEFYMLLKVLHDLVEAALAEDKSVQPKAPTTKQNRLSQPTRRLRPILQKACNACLNQLTARKAEQLRQTAPERSRKRKERLEAEERLAKKRFLERLRLRNKAIIASLDERRAELGLPPCSQSTETIPTILRAQAPKYKDGDTYGDVNYDMNRRLTGVFGHNNLHPGTTPKEWTKVEMEILVNGLREEQGPTRYEKLATKLERTLDEIFDRAKYLKMQIEYTLKRLQEEQPYKRFPPAKPWIENIGSEGFLNE